jgi:hypothetical protein
VAVTLDVRRTAAPAARHASRLRVLASGTATPQRLWRLGALLVVACLVTALVSTLAGSPRTDAVGAGGARLAALDTDATQLYRSLNEAEATASSGFASGGTASPTVWARYDDHISRATQRLVHAAGLLPPGGQDAALIELIASRLPDYTALIEAARTQAGQGSPGARESRNSAARLMRTTVLPAADTLRRAQETALAANYRRASAFPIAVVLVAAVALGGVGYAAVREQRRTNRILNPGLVTAGVLLAAGLLWWLVATFGAGDRLASARAHNDVARALDEARVAVLQARAAETTGLVEDGGFGEEFATRLQRLLGAGELLDTAAERAVGDAAAERIDRIRGAAIAWQEAHRRLRALDDAGDRQAALASAVGADPQGSRAMFERLNAALADALGAEQTALAIAVRRAASALTGVAVGPALLALLAAAAAAAGIGWRMWEYR